MFGGVSVAIPDGDLQHADQFVFAFVQKIKSDEGHRLGVRGIIEAQHFFVGRFVDGLAGGDALLGQNSPKN